MKKKVDELRLTWKPKHLIQSQLAKAVFNQLGKVIYLTSNIMLRCLSLARIRFCKLRFPVRLISQSRITEQKVIKFKLGEFIANDARITRTIDEESTNTKTLPPSLLYVQKLISQYPDHVVLTQMGSFFELYFDHASTYAPLLNIALTQRTYTHGKVPFAGFPVPQLSRHLKALVQDYGYSVVVAEQFKKDGYATNENNRFYRRVTRIVTPGTFIDEALDNYSENTFLLTIEFPENFTNYVAEDNLRIGISWCDISTGEIYIQELPLKDLMNAITRIKPKEILLNARELSDDIISGNWYPQLAELKRYFINYYTTTTRYRTLDTYFDMFAATRASGMRQRLRMELNEYSIKETAALRNLLSYVAEHLPECAINFQFPKRQITTDILQIDSRTTKALELHSTIRDNSKRGTLLNTMRRTVTPMGTRLLSQWLSGPSMNIKEIKLRQSIVSLFLADKRSHDKIISELKKIQDIVKLLQKFNFGRGTPLEMLELVKSLKTAQVLQSLLNDLLKESNGKSKNGISEIIERLTFPELFLEEISNALNEEHIIYQGERTFNTEGEIAIKETILPDERAQLKSKDNGYSLKLIINPEFSSAIQSLLAERSQLLSQKQNLRKDYETFFIDRFGVKSFLLKQKASGEFVIHVTATSTVITLLLKHLKENKESLGFTIVQKSSQTCWLMHKSWSDLADKLNQNEQSIRYAEDGIIDGFISEILKKSDDIRVVADAIGYIDTLCSFATLAEEKQLIKPKVDLTRSFEIVDGRHLVVEDALKKKIWYLLPRTTVIYQATIYGLSVVPIWAVSQLF